MKKITIILLVILAAKNLQAQNEKYIQRIKNEYKATKSSVAFSEQNPNKPKLYYSKFTENVNDKSWAAVGTYHYNIKMWYLDDPNNLVLQGAAPFNALQLIIVNGKKSAKKFYEEYYYFGGNLAFALYKSNNKEVKLYFKDKKLIKQIGEFEKYTSDSDELLKESVRYMNTFLASFGIYYSINR